MEKIKRLRQNKNEKPSNSGLFNFDSNTHIYLTPLGLISEKRFYYS